MGKKKTENKEKLEEEKKSSVVALLVSITALATACFSLGFVWGSVL